jgi:hypothetical protein
MPRKPEDLQNKIIFQGIAIIGIGTEHLAGKPIETVKAARRSKPNKPGTITVNGIYLVVGQSILHINPRKVVFSWLCHCHAGKKQGRDYKITPQ